MLSDMPPVASVYRVLRRFARNHRDGAVRVQDAVAHVLTGQTGGVPHVVAGISLQIAGLLGRSQNVGTGSRSRVNAQRFSIFCGDGCGRSPLTHGPLALRNAVAADQIGELVHLVVHLVRLLVAVRQVADSLAERLARRGGHPKAGPVERLSRHLVQGVPHLDGDGTGFELTLEPFAPDLQDAHVRSGVRKDQHVAGRDDVVQRLLLDVGHDGCVTVNSHCCISLNAAKSNYIVSVVVIREKETSPRI